MLLLGWAIIGAAYFQFNPWNCWFKTIVGIPCPGCGSTRAISALLQFNIKALAQYNVLALPVFFLFVYANGVYVVDLVYNKRNLQQQYSLLENVLKVRQWQMLLLGLVLLNWIWNIYKDV